jgi:hypothetical protein
MTPQALPPLPTASGFNTTTAATFWPHCSEGNATTAASAICGLGGFVFPRLVGSSFLYNQREGKGEKGGKRKEKKLTERVIPVRPLMH